MAFNKNTIKTLIKTRLQSISNDITMQFKQGNHVTEDAVNEKIATAIADAFAQFVQDAQVQVPVQAITTPHVALANGGGPVTGTITIPRHTGSIT